jgi:hypothetical protein
MTVVAHPPYFSVSLIKDKSDIIEVFMAEPQAVMNILIEYNFQDAFKKWQKHWRRCIHFTSRRMMVAIRLKVSFNQMAAQILEIMDDFVYYLVSNLSENTQFKPALKGCSNT